MSKSNDKVTQTAGSAGTAGARNGNSTRPGYFLSLSLENVRCFGPKQTLDLTDGRGRPARWTVILGLNGTGKTTVLQSLVSFELVPSPDPSGSLHQRFMTNGDLRSFCRGANGQPAVLTVQIAETFLEEVQPVNVATGRVAINIGNGSFDP